ETALSLRFGANGRMLQAIPVLREPRSAFQITQRETGQRKRSPLAAVHESANARRGFECRVQRSQPEQDRPAALSMTSCPSVMRDLSTYKAARWRPPRQGWWCRAVPAQSAAALRPATAAAEQEAR